MSQTPVAPPGGSRTRARGTTSAGRFVASRLRVRRIEIGSPRSIFGTFRRFPSRCIAFRGGRPNPLPRVNDVRSILARLRARPLVAFLLVYQFLFLNVVLPGHTRGAITTDGKHVAKCCCGGAR